MKKKVLIADRCKFFRAELKKMLIELGHEVVAEVSTGSKVFLEYAATRPDLVILELIFPDKNGIEIATRIMGIESKTKIVICSGSGNERFIRKALFEGVSSYLVKPITKAHLEAELNNI